MLLNVHGGPFTQYGETFFDEAQMQAAAGFVVVMSNPRGGSGRHTEWGQAIMGPRHPKRPGGGWGSVDVDDVLSVLDTALDRYPFCDRDRVGMLGGSYGGYMATMLAARYGDRFRGICSERSVNNLLTEEWSSDIATIFRVEHGPDPVEDPDEYLRMSPSVLARDIHVPMLLIHSENDFRCPINQAEELWVTLRLLGPRRRPSTGSPARTTSCRGAVRRSTGGCAPRSSSTGSPSGSPLAELLSGRAGLPSTRGTACGAVRSARRRRRHRRGTGGTRTGPSGRRGAPPSSGHRRRTAGPARHSNHSPIRRLYVAVGVPGRSAPSDSSSGGASVHAAATMLRSRVGVSGSSPVWTGVASSGRSS